MKHVFDLGGRVAVVTGAASGLGLSAALSFARAGADVALLARREEKIAANAEAIAAETGRRALAVRCDVSDEESARAAVERVVAELGKIDILVNAAGVAVGGDVTQLSGEDWDRSMRTNVDGVFHMCKYAVPHMRAAKYGKIVNIASVNAFLADKPPALWRHGYNTSKAAVVGLTKAMAASYGVDGITVNAVGPGLFKTEMTQNTLFANGDFMKMYEGLVPAGRAGQEHELDGPLLFFASDASAYVTGQMLYVDGGFSVV